MNINKRLLIALSFIFFLAPAITTSEPDPEIETSTTVEDTREVAPDFTLALGEGGAFTLSEEQNPVLLVFWAEW